MLPSIPRILSPHFLLRSPADPLAGKEASTVRRCLGVLKSASQQPDFLPPGGKGGGAGGGSHQQQANLVDTLGALR